MLSAIFCNLDHPNILLSGNELTKKNGFPKQALVYRYLQYKSKTMGKKEKLLIMSNFSFSHYVLYSPGELSAILINSKSAILILTQFGRV